MSGYSTREIADVLGVPTSRILAWTRSGLLSPQRGPRGAYLFSFQDIALLRTVRELLSHDVPTRKVRSALEALREQLPAGRPLSAVHISAVGDQVLVRDADATWHPDSGQMELDFTAQAPTEETASLATRRLSRADVEVERTADDWYDAAVELEATSLEAAEDAYRRALELDPEHADGLLNLGRLLHESGRLDEAEALYRAASSASPEEARAAYNLGVVLEDRGESTEAIDAYRRALSIDNDLGAAHFNLARLLGAAGHRSEGLRHLTEYKRLLARGETPAP